MPYSALYRTQTQAGLPILVTPSNVYLPQTSNSSLFSTGYLGSTPNLHTPAITLTSMSFSSSGNFRASNINFTSNITGNNLYVYSNALSFITLTAVNIGGNLAPYSNQITIYSNLNISSALNAPNLTGTIQTSNLVSTINIFSNVFRGNIIGYANSVQASSLTSPFIVAGNATVSNTISSTTIRVSNAVVAGSIEGSRVANLASIYTSGFIFGSLQFGTITASNIISANNITGLLVPCANNMSGMNFNISYVTSNLVVSNTANLSSLATPIVTGNIFAQPGSTANLLTTINVYSLAGSTLIKTDNVFVSNTLDGTILGSNNATVSSFMYSALTTGNVVGNVYTTGNIVTNYLWANVTAPFATIGTLNSSNNILSTSFYGQTANLQNITTVTTTGTVITSNATLTNNIYSTNINSPLVLSGNYIAQNTLSASNLIGSINSQSLFTFGTVFEQKFITGNVFGSNIFTTSNLTASNLFVTNVFADQITFGNISVTSQLTGSLTGSIANTSAMIYSSTVTISNGSISNIWTTTLFEPLFTGIYIGGNNTATVNNLYNTSLFASNLNLFTNTLTITNGISYVADLDKIGIFSFPVYPPTFRFLLANTLPQTSYVPTVSYYSTGGLTGYNGSVLLPDGRVVLVPNTAPNIGIFNPANNLFSTGPATNGYTGGVLLQNSNVALIPSSNTSISVFDPNAMTVTTGPSVGTGFCGGVLTPSGNVVCVPQLSSSLVEANVAAGTYTTVPLFSNGFYGGLINHVTGNVFCIPDSSTQLVSYTPGSRQLSNVLATTGYRGAVYTQNDDILLIPSAATSVSNITGSALVSANGYTSGCTAGNGKVIMAASGTVGILDTSTGSLVTKSVTAGYTSPLAIPDGRVVFAPQTATGGVMVLNSGTPLPASICTSPYLNKL